jgi:hypothetical protein
MEEPTCYELILTPSRSIPLAKLRKTDLISMLTENNSIIGDKGKRYDNERKRQNISAFFTQLLQVFSKGKQLKVKRSEYET